MAAFTFSDLLFKSSFFGFDKELLPVFHRSSRGISSRYLRATFQVPHVTWKCCFIRISLVFKWQLAFYRNGSFILPLQVQDTIFSVMVLLRHIYQLHHELGSSLPLDILLFFCNSILVFSYMVWMWLFYYVSWWFLTYCSCNFCWLKLYCGWKFCEVYGFLENVLLPIEGMSLQRLLKRIC